MIGQKKEALETLDLALDRIDQLEKKLKDAESKGGAKPAVAVGVREALEQFARDHAYASPQEAINNGNWFVEIKDDPFAATISLGMAGYSGYDDNGFNMRLMSALKHAIGKIKTLPKFDPGNQVVLAVAFVPKES